MKVSYHDKQSNLKLAFTDEVISELESCKQDATSPEAGGMLFSKDLYTDLLIVSRISLPKRNDTRLRFFFRINRKSAQRVIEKNFREGYYYIGDWHTHPEPDPTPSITDIKTIKSIFNESDHQLKYMFHTIIGNSDCFRPYVGITNGEYVRKLSRVEKF